VQIRLVERRVAVVDATFLKVVYTKTTMAYISLGNSVVILFPAVDTAPSHSVRRSSRIVVRDAVEVVLLLAFAAGVCILPTMWTVGMAVMGCCSYPWLTRRCSLERCCRRGSVLGLVLIGESALHLGGH